MRVKRCFLERNTLGETMNAPIERLMLFGLPYSIRNGRCDDTMSFRCPMGIVIKIEKWFLPGLLGQNGRQV
jgi:hypothetical protein